MYLVHVQVTGPEDVSFPDMQAEDVRAYARPEDGVEHVTMHPRAQPHSTLGIWVLAASLHAAEAQAGAFTRRLLHHHTLLDNWTLVRAEVPLLAPLGQALLGPTGNGSHHPGTQPKSS
jgi:hypothetical protein